MERLTYRENDIVYIVKDGELIAPVNMSSFDIRKALERLADYEDMQYTQIKINADAMSLEELKKRLTDGTVHVIKCD